MKLNIPMAKLVTPRLKRFSNLHVGETCYVFGDGPSIKWFDLRVFSDHPGLCCGMIPFHNDFESLDVRYISLVTPWAFVPRIYQPKLYHPNRLLYEEYRQFIARTSSKEFFVSLSNVLAVSGANVNYVFRGLPRNDNQIDKMLGQFDLFSGSFHASLALAYYLGFSKAYLIGFDAWTIRPARTGRWYELGPGEVFESGDQAAGFLAILRKRMDIYTISPYGSSPNVRNISYEAYTGKPPTYRENTELMSRRHLEVMASCPGNRVFAVEDA